MAAPGLIVVSPRNKATASPIPSVISPSWGDGFFYRPETLTLAPQPPFQPVGNRVSGSTMALPTPLVGEHLPAQDSDRSLHVHIARHPHRLRPRHQPHRALPRHRGERGPCRAAPATCSPARAAPSPPA